MLNATASAPHLLGQTSTTDMAALCCLLVGLALLAVSAYLTWGR